MEETLQFVKRLGEHLGVDVAWLEYTPSKHQKDAWKPVTFDSAARKGEPFAQIIDTRGYTPNPVARICTMNLKIKPMEGLMRQLGYKDYLSVSGIRADEPRRIARLRAREDMTFDLPLVDAGITHEDVVAFWKGMPFDLELPTINGKTVHGNCYLCYLKGPNQIISLIREQPSRADWWIEQEVRSGKLFRIDRPNYAALKVLATQPQLFEIENELQDGAMPCECTE
jgi:hypothetical protein